MKLPNRSTSQFWLTQRRKGATPKRLFFAFLSALREVRERQRLSYSGMQVVRLVSTVGVVAFVCIALLWAGAVAAQPATPTAAAEPAGGAALNNGPVITIGVGAALSVVPDVGWRQVNAVQLAVDQVNAGGGIDIAGTVYTLALAVADDGCSAAQGGAAATALLNAGAVAVVGYTCTGASNAAQPLHAAAGVPMISPSSTGVALTGQGYTTTFRVTSRDDSPSILLATYLRNWLKLEQGAIIELDGFWGNWSTDVFSTTFTTLGGAITSRRTVASSAEFTAALTALQAEAPAVIFYSDVDGENAGSLSSVAYGLGMTDTIIAWNTLTDDETVLAGYAARAGAAAEGDHAGMSPRRTQDMPGYGPFNAAYQAAGFPNFGDDATATGAFAYDAANIILAAIGRAQSTDPTAIRDAIASTTGYVGVVGVYTGFDAWGDVMPQWAWLEEYADGQWTVLQPGKMFLPVTLKEIGQ